MQDEVGKQDDVGERQEVSRKRRAELAIDALNTWYDPHDGLWQHKGAPWWYSAVCLRLLVDYMLMTGDHKYLAQAKYTIDHNRKPIGWWRQGGGDFRADSTDDTAWWALAMLSMFQLTGDPKYIEIAIRDEAYMHKYWGGEGTSCGAGLIWDIRRNKYVNAISNTLYFELTITLHNHIPGDTMYLQRALETWIFLQKSGMMNEQGLFNDGMVEDPSRCESNGRQVWTYNQGPILNALLGLSRALNNKHILDTAHKIAHAVINSTELSPFRILNEPGCATVEHCFPNGEMFKGIFMRNLGFLNVALEGQPYSNYIEHNARTAIHRAREVKDGSFTEFYGFKWQGPFDKAGVGQQAAVANLLVVDLVMDD
ncbi:glycoside hydrolase family 76 protein [Xylariaceae sp. FL1019]|nr:glycoside hydrolase family 76 protein [Xylariaceae sp. FL1019]